MSSFPTYRERERAIGKRKQIHKNYHHFSEVKCSKTTLILTFFSQRVSTCQNDNWKPMEETTCNSQQYLYMIFCIYFAWPSLLRNVEPCGWGGEKCHQWQQQLLCKSLAVTLDSYFSPQKYLTLGNLTAAASIPVPPPCHGNSIQIGRFSPLIPFE